MQPITLDWKIANQRHQEFGYASGYTLSDKENGGCKGHT